MIRSLGFLGVRTDAFAATTALYRDVLGGSAWNQFHGPDGNVYEIIGPDGATS
jgi:hypothetical protein